MKKILLTSFIFLIALFCCVQAVSASVNFEVKSIEILPSGDLSPGDQVTVHVVVRLIGTGDYVFPDTHDLDSYTELANPVWKYSVYSGDIPIMSKEDTGRRLSIDGFELSYASGTNIEVDYVLEGDAPSVSTSGNMTVIRIEETDSYGVFGDEYIVEQQVLNPADIETLREILNEDLDELRADIDEKAAIGVNTTAAEAKYSAAEIAIKNARTAAYSDANAYLTQAGTYIDEANEILDNAWAQKMIDDADASIIATEQLIQYFTANRSMGDDSRVINIDSKLNLAKNSLSSAKDFRSNGDYAQARYQAEDAKGDADEALAKAQALREEIGEGGLIPAGIGDYLFIALGVIVVAIVGFVVYRRFTSWDELG